MRKIPISEEAEILDAVYKGNNELVDWRTSEGVAYYGVDIAVEDSFAWARLLSPPTQHGQLLPRWQPGRWRGRAVPALFDLDLSAALQTLLKFLQHDLSSGRGVVLGFEAPMWTTDCGQLASPSLQGRFPYERNGNARSKYCWTAGVGAQQTVKAIAIGRTLVSALGSSYQFLCARRAIVPKPGQIAVFEGYFTSETGLLDAATASAQQGMGSRVRKGTQSNMRIWPAKEGGSGDCWDAYSTAVAGYLFVKGMTGNLLGPNQRTYRLRFFCQGDRGVAKADVSHWDTILAVAGVPRVGGCPVLSIDVVPGKSPTQASPAAAPPGPSGPTLPPRPTA